MNPFEVFNPPQCPAAFRWSFMFFIGCLLLALYNFLKYLLRRRTKYRIGGGISNGAIADAEKMNQAFMERTGNPDEPAP